MGEPVEIAGLQLTCPVCRGVEFETRPGLLNTAGMTFLEMDWLNRGATLCICRTCQHVMWFADPE